MRHKTEYEEHLRLILIGDSYVGKSCLLARFFEHADFSEYCCTLGVDQEIKFLRVRCRPRKVEDRGL